MNLTPLLAAAPAPGSNDGSSSLQTDAGEETSSAWSQLAGAISDLATNAIEWVSLLGMLMVGLCILASLYRILRGPTLTDRILASDALSLFVVALVLLLGETLKTAVYYDAALMVAILGFVATLAMSRFLLTMNRRDEAPGSPGPPVSNRLSHGADTTTQEPA